MQNGPPNQNKVDLTGKKVILRNLIPMISKLRQYGAENVFYKFYEDARHDLFFEINRRQVYEDVFKFIRIVQKQQLNKQLPAK